MNPNNTPGNTPIPEIPQEELQRQLVRDVHAALRNQETSIQKRNAAIDKRYRAIYSDGLLDGIPKKIGFDSTPYNFLNRVVEIMATQLFGRSPNIISTYDKENLGVYDLPAANDDMKKQQDQEKQQAEIHNARLKEDADLRVQAALAIIADNGGFSLFNRGGKMGSYSGITVYKHWVDKKAKRYNINLLENPNNFFRKWADDNFRDWDWSAYCYQISESNAYKLYGDYIKDGEFFQVAKPGGSAWNVAAAADVNDLPNPMVWVIDLVGEIDSYGVDKSGYDFKLKKVKRGKQDEANYLIVGGKLVCVETKDLPKYTVINNIEEPLNPWGVSDISDDAIEINRTIIQIAQSWVTLGFKSLFYKLKFKNFTSLNIPKNLDMEVQGIPMDSDQDIEPIQQPQTFGEFQRILEWLINSFVRVTRIGRVMFDDPTSTSNSNQAMMTSMKGLIDTIEDKQSRWTPAIIEMLTAGLEATADFDKSLKEAYNSGDGWKLRIEWPSILRREDQAYQAMWNNTWNSGVLSPETYMEKMGIEDPSEEMDRMRDALQDPVRAAMVGHALGEMASHTINKSLGIPPWGYVTPKVTLRGDLTPQQEANMAENYDWNSGPFGSSMGPQGNAGTAANDNFINDGQIDGNPFNGGMPHGAVPHTDAQQPQVNTNPGGMNPVSQAGVSQPTPVSAQGAVNQVNQRQGK